MKEFFTADVETSAIESSNPYALEPYRVYSNQARITTSAIWSSKTGLVSFVDNNHGGASSGIVEQLKSLQGKIVFAQYAPFDVAWYIATTSADLCRGIHWADTSTLGKWVENGQNNLSFSLKDMVERWVDPETDGYEEFLGLKERVVVPGEDEAYWAKRNVEDVKFTYLLADTLLKKLTARQIRSYMQECGNIFPAARAWVEGLKYDLNEVSNLEKRVVKASANILKELKIDGAVLRSPKQLSNFLYTENDFPVIQRTDKGAPSTSEETLFTLQFNMQGTPQADIINLIIKYRKLNTLKNKYLDSVRATDKYNGDGLIHASPRIFGTYTGRYTYSSKTLKDKKFASGHAVHQIPRLGPVRKIYTAPEGYGYSEFDAANQESRIIAIKAKDEAMIDAFLTGKSLHSMMGSEIHGLDYEDFEQRYHDGDSHINEVRQAGKLLNLSCQYRIGAKALAKKFLTKYGIYITVGQAAYYLKQYTRRWKGIEPYWENAISIGRELEYAESLGGRRYYLDKWKTRKWGTESSAINFPIQGSGGDHKNVAITHLNKHFPELVFNLDLHDGIFYWYPLEHGEELVLEARNSLNKLNYSEIWDRDIPIDLPFDAKIGPNLKDMKELA